MAAYPPRKEQPMDCLLHSGSVRRQSNAPRKFGRVDNPNPFVVAADPDASDPVLVFLSISLTVASYRLSAKADRFVRVHTNQRY